MTMGEGVATREPQSRSSVELASQRSEVKFWVPSAPMPDAFTAQQVLDLEAVLSPPRFGTYLRATGGDRPRAMDLYCWNTDLSAAFYVMLQFCEIGTRNGAVEAVEAEFGPNWHLNRGFYRSLPCLAGGRGYQPAEDVANQAQRQPTSGKVVAELKFAFWQYLFVRGQDRRLWDQHLRTAFPGIPADLTVAQARGRIHADIEIIRRLRNRIAHHEPIFSRDLAADHRRIRGLISWRRPDVATWLDGRETVSALLQRRP